MILLHTRSSYRAQLIKIMKQKTLKKLKYLNAIFTNIGSANMLQRVIRHCLFIIKKYIVCFRKTTILSIVKSAEYNK